jgi:hypothetical protein
MTGFAPPNAKQVEIIKSVAFIIKSWAATNDISSPTHSSDILEELKKLDLDAAEEDALYRSILDIWFRVLVCG